MARLTAEEKALLARILEAQDDDEEDDTEPEQEADEFTYQGKRYVYTPDELEEVQEEVKPVKKARPAAAVSPVAKKKVVVPKPPPAPVDPEPEEDPEPQAATRRFHT